MENSSQEANRINPEAMKKSQNKQRSLANLILVSTQTPPAHEILF